MNNQNLRDPNSPYNRARRHWLERALRLGLVGLGAGLASTAAPAQWFGSRPQAMPANRNFARIDGDVQVNGAPASLDTPVRPGDVVSTGPNSSTSFVLGADAYLLRENSRMRVLRPRPKTATEDLVEQGLELLKGAALFVFGRREEQRIRVSTSLATLGIRGTGLYMRAEENRTYVCLCYGRADLGATANPDVREQLQATHHDMPKYVYGAGATEFIEDAPFEDHSDLELAVLEDLVGRTVPFPLDEYYDSPRRQDY